MLLACAGADPSFTSSSSEATEDPEASRFIKEKGESFPSNSSTTPYSPDSNIRDSSPDSIGLEPTRVPQADAPSISADVRREDDLGPVIPNDPRGPDSGTETESIDLGTDSTPSLGSLHPLSCAGESLLLQPVDTGYGDQAKSSSLITTSDSINHIVYTDTTFQAIKYANGLPGEVALDSIVDFLEGAYLSEPIIITSAGQLQTVFFDLTLYGQLDLRVRSTEGVWLGAALPAVFPSWYFSLVSLPDDTLGLPYLSFLATPETSMHYMSNGTGVWAELETIAATGVSASGCLDAVVGLDSIIHIFTYDTARTPDALVYLHSSPSGWSEPEVVDLFAGIECTASLGPEGPRVSYHDSAYRALKYARLEEGIWATEYVDLLEDAGLANRLLTLPDSRPLAVYTGGLSGLRYATKDLGAVSWEVTTVDPAAIRSYSLGATLTPGPTLHITYPVTGLGGSDLWYACVEL